MTRHTMNIRMPLDLYESLQFVAQKSDLSMNAVAVLAMRQYLGYAKNASRLPSLDLEKEAEIDVETPPKVVPLSKSKWNAPCPCGSGKRHKRCCGKS